MEDDKKELHDSNKGDSISCEGSTSDGACSVSTASANMDSGNHHMNNSGLDNDAFENSGELAPSPISSSSSSSTKKKNGHTSVDLELDDLSPPKIMASEKEAAIHEAEFNDAGSTNGQVGDYFISINEHKKGLRGEKLIVTKDNRPHIRNSSNNSKARKCVCWSVGIVVVVALATVGGLIGTGIIDPKSHRMLGQKDGRARDVLAEDSDKPFFSEVVQSGGAISGNSLETDDHHHDDDDSFPAGVVKNAYSGQFRITNLSWDRRLKDTTSGMYQELSSKLKNAIEEILAPLNTDGHTKFFVTIKEFTAGSVVVHFRIGWTKDNVDSSDDHHLHEDHVTRDVILHRFENSLESNQGIFGSIYNAESDSLTIQYVQDNCHSMRCGGSCEYNMSVGDFFCVCPENAYLNSDGISCVVDDQHHDADLSAEPVDVAVRFGADAGDEVVRHTTEVGDDDDVVPQSTPRQTTMVTMDYPIHDDSEVTEPETNDDTTSKTEEIPVRHGEVERATEQDQTTLGSTTEHPVQWLSENGDIMVPVVDHESSTTTLVKIGHVDSSETDVEETTVHRVQWTTEAPVEETTKTVVWINEEEDSEIAATTSPTSEYQVDKTESELVADVKEAEPEMTTATLEEVTDSKEDEKFVEVELKNNAIESTTTTTTTTTEEETETDQENEGETTISPEVANIKKEEEENESSTSHVEISLPMLATKDMPEEFHDQLEDMMMSIIKDMTTTEVPEEVVNMKDLPETTEENAEAENEQRTESAPAAKDSSEETSTDSDDLKIMKENVSSEASSELNEVSSEETEVVAGSTTTPSTAAKNVEVSSEENSSEELIPATTTTTTTTASTTTEKVSSETTTTTEKPVSFEGSVKSESSTLDDESSTSRNENEEEATESNEESSALQKNDIVAEALKSPEEDPTGKDSTTPADFHIDISGLKLDQVDGDKLSQALENIVAQVTRDLQSSTTPITLETTTTPSAADLPVASALASDVVETVSNAQPRQLLDDSNESTTHQPMNRSSPTTGTTLTNCSNDQFRCGDGYCIDRTARCDKIFDCVDSSDEEDCADLKCDHGEFECGVDGKDRRCLPDSRRCDGHVDCAGGEDESGCKTDGDSCGSADDQEKMFFCSEQKRCLPLRLRCDGTPDCTSGEDEKDCTCRSDEVACRMSGGCVRASAICDGHYDCPDTSDEWNCLRIMNATLQVRHPEKSWEPVCATGWNETWSLLACKQLGFEGLDKTLFTELKPNAEYFSLNASILPETVTNVQAAAANTKEENCDLSVALQCEEFECGIWTLDENATSLLAGNATSANDLELPSMAYLLNVRDKASCTVSIVHPKWILTSYSCLADYDFDPSQWVALGGSSSSDAASESSSNLQPSTQIKVVRRIVTHPQARVTQGFVENDLALVELLDGFDLNDHVSTVCLMDSEPEQGQLCITTGWSNVGTDVVKLEPYVELLPNPSVDMESCNSTEHYNGLLDQSVICAGARSEKQPCRRDKGAPLMCKNDFGVWQLHGLLTREGECRPRPHPDVFASIRHSRDWIENVIGSA